MRLEDTTVRSLPAPDKGQKTYRDDVVPGFGVRVSQAGTKSFVVIYGNDRRYITIGRFPTISLSQARTEAKRLLAEFTLGKVRPQSITYLQGVELFIQEKAKSRKRGTVVEYERLLKRLRFGQLLDVNPHEFARQLNKVKFPSERDHLLVAARVFFRWAVKRHYIERDPTMGLEKAKTKRRTRTLTDDEIRALWAVPGKFADYVRGLLCTGQRRTELVHAVVAQDTFVIPEEFSKNHRANTLPICPLARPFIQDYPIFDWSRNKIALDEASGVRDWQLRDCRRTVRSGLAALRVPPWIARRILNHARDPLDETYDTHDPVEEKREALLKWEQHLTKILAG